MPGIIVKDVHRTKQRINTTCDGINLLSFFPAKVETQGGGGGVNMELITKKVAAGKTVGLSRCRVVWYTCIQNSPDLVRVPSMGQHRCAT